MIKEGITAPSGMKNPAVHHIIPWKFKDKVAGFGVDVNRIEFGKWVEGGKGSKHAKLSYKYNKQWEAFLNNPKNQNYEAIVNQANQWRNYI